MSLSRSKKILQPVVDVGINIRQSQSFYLDVSGLFVSQLVRPSKLLADKSLRCYQEAKGFSAWQFSLLSVFFRYGSN